MAFPAGVRLGVYEVVSPLGAGGMGEVYRARDAKLGREVALKLLPVGLADNHQALARQEREARTLASLNHPNIAAIYGLEESNGLRALVMELVEGETLTERIHGPAGASQRSLPADETLFIARQIAEALEYAHERGVIHRDLKPANVKITPEGMVKVLDFGLAKVLSDQDSTAPVASPNSPTLSAMATQAGIILGTAAYMAPEQAKGKQVDRRADIWAFGCVLFEMLAGKKPFDGETISDVLAAVIKSEPDWAALRAGTPIPIRRLIRRCLQKDARQRLQAIGDARIAIEETISGTGAEVDIAISAGQIGETKRISLLGRSLPLALSATTVLFGTFAAWLLLKPHTQQSVVRFSVVSPENSDFVVGSYMSLSPDGRTLAIVARAGPDKPNALWLRPLDSLTAHPILGTDGASSPFWSPDSQQIGFEAGGKLMKLASGGGTPQTLCDTKRFDGGTWNRDGVILFVDNGVLFRVPDTGGEPALVLAADASRHESSFGFPQFLPDGRHFVFEADAGASADNTVEVGSLDSKVVVRLMPADAEAYYASPGYLFYTLQQTLMARPFNTKALRFTGPALPISQNVGRMPYFNYAFFSVSPAGVLAYQSTAIASLNQATWFSRAGEKLGTVGPPDIHTAPAISPDGSRLAVAIGDFGKRDIWIFDLKRGTASRLTFGPADTTNTTWSADGTHIMFSSNHGGRYDLYQKAANGLGGTQPLFQSAQEKHLDDLSSDGHYAIYDTANDHEGLWVLPFFGDRKPFPFLQGGFLTASAVFSPKGRYVAYMSSETGSYEIYVQTFPQQTGKWQISTSGGLQPEWSRNGKELFYLSRDGRLMAVEVNTTAPIFEAGTPKPLFQTQLDTTYRGRNFYVVSPDGQRFLVLEPVTDAAPPPITVVVNWQALLRK